MRGNGGTDEGTTFGNCAVAKRDQTLRKTELSACFTPFPSKNVTLGSTIILLLIRLRVGCLERKYLL